MCVGTLFWFNLDLIVSLGCTCQGNRCAFWIFCLFRKQASENLASKQISTIVVPLPARWTRRHRFSLWTKYYSWKSDTRASRLPGSAKTVKKKSILQTGRAHIFWFSKPRHICFLVLPSKATFTPQARPPHSSFPTFWSDHILGVGRVHASRAKRLLISVKCEWALPPSQRNYIWSAKIPKYSTGILEDCWLS